MFCGPVDFGHKCNEVVASAARARPEVNALHHLLEKQQAGSSAGCRAVHEGAEDLAKRRQFLGLESKFVFTFSFV